MLIHAVTFEYILLFDVRNAIHIILRKSFENMKNVKLVCCKISLVATLIVHAKNIITKQIRRQSNLLINRLIKLLYKMRNVDLCF